MRDPTKQEIAKFRRACAALDALGRAGFHIYLANDNLNLMISESHDDNGRPLQDNVRATENICGSGGGDW